MKKILPLVSKVVGIKIPRTRLKPPRGFKIPNVKKFKEDMQRLGEDIAEGFKEEIVENIEENKFGYANAPSTLKNKEGDTPLVNTHTLVDAIYREGTLVSVEDTPREDSSLTNKELAIVQEYGTKDAHIPARPVWRDTFKEYKSKAREQVKDFLDTHKFKRNEET